MSEKHPYLGNWILTKTPPWTCPECGVEHPPEDPHNRDSLAYQYGFYGKYGRWPTWADAMAHCSPKVQKAWMEALQKRGIAWKAK
jgi:hypothetical protein